MTKNLSASEQFEELRRRIEAACWQAQDHLAIWRNMIESHNEVREVASAWYQMTYVAHYEAAFMRIAKLVDDGKNLNLGRYLKFIRENPGIFKKEKQELLKNVSEDEEILREKADICDEISHVRNNHYGHLSVRFLDDYQAIFRGKEYNADSLASLLVWIGDTLMKYSGFYDRSATAMGSSTRLTLDQATRSFSFLDRCVKKGKEKMQEERERKRAKYLAGRSL